MNGRFEINVLMFQSMPYRRLLDVMFIKPISVLQRPEGEALMKRASTSCMQSRVHEEFKRVKA